MTVSTGSPEPGDPAIDSDMMGMFPEGSA